ncbi:hypothetical protein F53441_6489 [Fusarium austroafricanum]|uniref:DUF7918 domain-containing protein n=1 Tax=Fusarium austroafricanum TaxID=2364996 RepID=A0A8H4KHQ9_9HYPO|nr:hypothetical protein F53441_6489 [Fusarium austroafricanum]
MAIIPEVRGLEVQILVADNVAKEQPVPNNLARIHRTKNPDTPLAVRCIHSETGKPWSIRVTVSNDFKLSEGADLIALDIIADGIRFRSPVIESSKLSSHHDSVFNYSSRRNNINGTTQREQPVFSDIHETEEEDAEIVNSDLRRLKNMGTIKVIVACHKLKKKWVADRSLRSESGSMHVAAKAMVLKGEDQTHGTRFTALGSILDSKKTKISSQRLREVAEFHFCYSAPRHIEVDDAIPKIEPKIEPKTESMQTLRTYPNEELVNGRPLIDLTHED